MEGTTVSGMEVQKIEITERRGIILTGNALVNGVYVAFAYNKRADNFTAISYNKYEADGKLPECHNRSYLIGRKIAAYIKISVNL